MEWKSPRGSAMIRVRDEGRYPFLFRDEGT